MQAAIQAAELNQTPFGAALAMGDEVFAIAVSQPIQKGNSTACAETSVIRQVKDQTRKNDLSGFILYSTCETLPDCMYEINGSGIKTIVYGCGTEIVGKYLNQINLQATGVSSDNSNEIEVISGFMEKECKDLLRKFS